MSNSVEPLDVDSVRRDFPILNRPFDQGRHRKGSLPVFLDSAASAQKPRCVIELEREVEEQYFANAYRGVYYFGARVDEELEASREAVRALLSAESTSEIVFTSGTTMSLNLVARAWGGKFLEPGDEVLITEMEHHANIVPWQIICAERGATLRWLPLTADQRLDLDRLDEFLTPKTKLVSVTSMSNMLGTINPIRELAQRAHAVERKFWWTPLSQRRTARRMLWPTKSIFSQCPATNCTARRASAFCTDAANFWKR